MKFDAAKVAKRAKGKTLSAATRAVLTGSKIDDVALATLDLKTLAACSADQPTTKKLRTTRVKKLLVHHGDLHVTGNLEVLDRLVVTGDVVVTGLMFDAAPASLIAIGGDVTCGSLITAGAMSCNAIKASGLVHADGNDFTLECGEIRAYVVIRDGHDIQHAGIKAKLNVETADCNGGFGAITKKLGKFFKPKFFSVDEDDEPVFDLTAVGYAIAKGRDPFVRP